MTDPYRIRTDETWAEARADNNFTAHPGECRDPDGKSPPLGAEGGIADPGVPFCYLGPGIRRDERS